MANKYVKKSLSCKPKVVCLCRTFKGSWFKLDDERHKKITRMGDWFNAGTERNKRVGRRI